MLNRNTRPNYYNPYLQSNPYNQQSSLHYQSQSDDSGNININHNYLSDPYDFNQRQTQRTPFSQQGNENTQQIQIRNNVNKNLKNNLVTQQIGSYKINRNPNHMKKNQVYKNPYQNYENSFIPSHNKDLQNKKVNNSQQQQSQSDGISQSQEDIQQESKQKILNDRSVGKQNNTKISNRPKSGHLVSFGNMSSSKQQVVSIGNSNHNSKNYSLKNGYQKPRIFDKQNNEPNSSYSNSQSDYQSQQSLQKIGGKIDENNYKLNDNKTNTIFYQQQNSSNQLNLDFVNVKKNKTSKSESQLLMPIIINTVTGQTYRQSEANFNSNSIIDQSSISRLCQSSRISQQDTQITYLKQKLVQTHTKLIKQLQISKELEDNFFALKKKYQIVISGNKNNKIFQQQIYQLQSQLKNKQKQLSIKQGQFKRKQDEWKTKQEKYTQRQQSLINQLTQQRKKQSQRTKQIRSLNEKVAQLKQQINELHDQCTHLNEEIQSHKTTIEEIQNEKQKLKFYLDQSKKNQALLNQKVNQLQLNKYSSRDLHQILQSKQAIINQQINQNKNIFVEENQKLIQKNQQLKNDLENMRNKVLTLNKLKEQLTQELQQVNQSHSNYTLQINQLQEKLTKKHKQFTQKEQLAQIWRKKYSDAQQESKKISQNIIRHQNQTKQLKNLNSQLNIALRQEKQKNAQMLSEIINIQMETKELKSKINTLKQEKQQLQDKLFEITPQKNALHQKQQLQHQLQKLTTEYNSLSAIINKKDKDISQLKAQLLQTQTLINKFTTKQRQLQQRSRDLDQLSKQLEQRQQQLLQQKLTKMNSVKSFVNQLEDQKDRSVAMKRTSQQINRENRARTPTHIQKQNVFNHSNLKIQTSSNNNRSLSPLSTPNIKINPYEDKRNQRRSGQQYGQQNYHLQEQNTCLTPSRSLSNLNVKTLNNNNNHSLSNQYQNNLMNPKITQINKQKQLNSNYEQNLIVDYQSYEDSLQTANNVQINRKPIKTQFQIHKNDIELDDNFKQKQFVDKNVSLSVTPLKDVRKNLTVSQSKLKGMKGQQKCLTSYKQEKEQYLCLLEQIGQLETQSYNLGQEKKKILQQLQRIENTKIKTKQMIAKRRQLQLWLLGNEKKNNQVREQLKSIRGKVV